MTAHQWSRPNIVHIGMNADMTANSCLEPTEPQSHRQCELATNAYNTRSVSRVTVFLHEDLHVFPAAHERISKATLHYRKE